MQYTHLGRTGVVVSRLCLGTMNFGCYTSEEESLAILNQALAMGINFVDTANAYGWLDDQTQARLNEIRPGPGGEAPEAYTL